MTSAFSWQTLFSFALFHSVLQGQICLLLQVFLALRRSGVAIMVNKRVRNAILGCNLKNYRMISFHFQGKPFNITVIQVYAPTTNAEEAEVEQFCEDPEDLLELTTPKDVLFIIGDGNAKDTWSNRQIWPWSTK